MARHLINYLNIKYRINKIEPEYREIEIPSFPNMTERETKITIRDMKHKKIKDDNLDSIIIESSTTFVKEFNYEEN